MEFLLAGCESAFLINKNIYLSLFLGGLLGSLNHCAGMCGPFIVAQTSHPTGTDSIMMRVTGSSLIPYHLGRMTTYVILGTTTSFVLIPFLGTDFGHIFITTLLAAAGIIFILHGMSINKHISFPFSHFLSKLTTSLSFEASHMHKFALGLILGFMPCALVFAAILAVSSLANPFDAMFGMIAFTVGTLPILIGIGFVSHSLMQKYKPLYTKITKAMMILNGFVLMTLSMEKII